MVDRFSKIILSLSLCSGTLLVSNSAAEIVPDHEIISASQTDNGVLAEVAVSEAKESLDLRKEEKAADKLAVLKKDPLAIEQGDPELESETVAESNAEPGLIAEIEAVAESTVEGVFERDHFAALTESSRRVVRELLGRPFSAVSDHKNKNVTSDVKGQTTQPEPEIQFTDLAVPMDEDAALFDPATIPGVSALDLNEFDDTYPVEEDWEEAFFEGSPLENEPELEIDDYELIVDEDDESEILEDSASSDEIASDQDEEVWEDEVIEDPDHEYFEITIKGKNPQAVMQHFFKFYGEDPQDFDETVLTNRIRGCYEIPQRVFANWNPFQNYWGQSFGYPRNFVYPQNLTWTRNLPWYMRSFF